MGLHLNLKNLNHNHLEVFLQETPDHHHHHHDYTFLKLTTMMTMNHKIWVRIMRSSWTLPWWSLGLASVRVTLNDDGLATGCWEGGISGGGDSTLGSLASLHSLIITSCCFILANIWCIWDCISSNWVLAAINIWSLRCNSFSYSWRDAKACLVSPCAWWINWAASALIFSVTSCALRDSSWAWVTCWPASAWTLPLTKQPDVASCQFPQGLHLWYP